MGKKSISEDKNIYWLCREEAGLTRAAAGELLFMGESKIEKIEKGLTNPAPEDVQAMAAVYHRPELLNYFCVHECAIGQKYVPEIELKSISEIVISIVDSINELNDKKNRLIQIISDGKITLDELRDFAKISNALRALSLSVDTMDLWLSSDEAKETIEESLLEQLRELL